MLIIVPFCMSTLNPNPRLRGIAVEVSGVLTKVLPRQCGGNTLYLLYILGKKGREMKI